MRWALARTAPRTESRKEMMGLKSRTILGFNRDHGFAKGFSKRLATHDRDTGLCRKDTMTSKATRQSPQNSAFGTRRCLARVTCVRILSSLELPSELFQTLCVTFLVGFFSYCRYRDSTIFPPVGNTLLVYNKTTIAVCADPPAPRTTPPPPEPGAIGPPCSTADPPCSSQSLPFSTLKYVWDTYYM